MNAWAAVLVCVVAASSAACAGKQPAQPTSTVVELRIAGPNTLRIGQTASYTATAVSSDGTTAPANAAWTSATPDVAEISAGGQLTALQIGATTISAHLDGRAATVELLVANPLVGDWVLAAATTPGNPSGIGTRTKTFSDDDQWDINQLNPTTGALVFRHGGTYRLRGTEYSETVVHANPSTPGLIGSTFTARVTVNAEASQFTQTAPNGSTEEWNSTSR